MSPGINFTAICIADGFGAFLAIVMLSVRIWSNKGREKETKLLRLMFASVLICCISDIVAFGFDGRPGAFAFLAVYVGNLILYLSNMIIGTLWVVLLITHVYDEGISKFQKGLIITLDVIGSVALIINFFAPLVFSVSPENVYSRETIYWVYMAIEMIFSIDGVIIYYIAKRKHDRIIFFPVWQFIIPALLGIGIQTFVYGVSTIWPAISIAVCCMVFALFTKELNEQKVRLLEEGRLIAAENQLRHETLRREVLDYMVNENDDPIELLKKFAERIRVLINCDQVIYRDLEETRIMVNSPDIEETWSVPIEFCQQCEHFDAHHPMYDGGYTEMDNCQEGWQGIPVYHDCPIKSSLTRIVYCDGEVAGYLAIHYVQDYHKFTDIERSTLEEFTRILSMSLSRYEAKKENKELKRIAEMQEQLKESSEIISGLASEYLALYYVNIDDGTFRVYSLDGRRLPDTKQLVSNGGDPFELIQRFGASEAVHPEDRHLFENINVGYVRERLNHSKRFSTRFRRNYDGVYLWSEMDVVKYEDADDIANVIAIGFAERDKEIRREGEQQKQLRDALDMAQSANNAKSTFLFNMSHDIRTPMNAILGYTDMAIRHIDDGDTSLECLRKIKSSGGHLLSLINDILEMSRIEAGKLELSREPLDIRQAISNTRHMSDVLAASKGINFEVNVGEIKNPYVYADELHFNEVLINIISNAMKYSYDEGTVRYSVNQISDAVDGTARYRFEVADNGIGMSEEFLEHIYENFAREKSTTVSKLEGAGLGLSIVKRIVDLAEGTIDIRSEVGEGTTVIVEFPFRVMDDEAIEKFLETRSHTVDVDEDLTLEGKRVLLVEDNEMNREIAEEILLDAALIVETAEDGEVAVRKVLEKGVTYYDFILMDIQMPVMNGYDATEAIRRLPGGEKIPIIAVSANAFDEDRQKSIEAGMNAHIAKPIDIKALFAAMRGLVTER